VGGKGGGGSRGGEMTHALYAHMNNKRKKIYKIVLLKCPDISHRMIIYKKKLPSVL
jgi:hypothetical protein